ncbi:unnamed protein product [Trichobilharzia szidati]|nr:unnamed protein product [Trichobilharzia szidati]
MLPTREIVTLTEMLVNNYRLDGRSLSEYREISFRFPQGKDREVSGCCVVKIGATSVMAQVSAEVIEPKHFRPSQGMLFVHFDASILKLCKTVYHKQKRDDEGRRLSAVLQTLLRDCIDLDSLCIVAWERVFAIRVELRALSYDGNLGDCGALAAVAALAAFRRPDVFVDDMGKVSVDFEAKFRPRVPLSVRRIPVLVTLGLSNDAKVALVDPTAREEFILNGGRIMLGLTSSSEICCLYTTGLSVPIKCSSLSKCIRLANTKAKCLVPLLNEIREISQSMLDAPLVLSTASFLLEENNQANATDREEGEILPEDNEFNLDSDDDMDVVSSEEDKPSATAVHNKHQSPKKFSPYGVIEVSSSSNRNVDTDIPDSSANDLYELDPVHMFHAGSLIPGAINESNTDISAGIDGRIRSANEEDEEDEVIVLNLV